MIATFNPSYIHLGHVLMKAKAIESDGLFRQLGLLAATLAQRKHNIAMR